MNESDAWLRLALVPGLGPLTAQKLLAQLDGPQDVFRLGMSQLQRFDGIGAGRARRICDPAGEELLASERARCYALGIHISTLADADYPEVFRRLPDPPLAIWQQGELQRHDRIALAVVGPRTPSAYGHRQAHLLAGGLARLGVTVISGLARGIDTVAHQAALEAGGRTIAVLGSGLAQPYPSENTGLLQRIVAGKGAVLSEFPADMKPAPGHFPRRNRLVAALSLGVLVIEADQRSGALITARLAAEQGHEVMALPGPVDRNESKGANQLLRDGATLVTSLDDIIQEIEAFGTLAAVSPPPPDRSIKLNNRERDIYTLLDDTPRSVDDLVRVSGLPVSGITATLISLELRRCARKVAGGYVKAL